MQKLFSSPLDVSAKYAGFGLCKGVALIAINYDAGSDRGYIVNLIRADGSVDSAILGIPHSSPSELTTAADCAAYFTS